MNNKLVIREKETRDYYKSELNYFCCSLAGFLFMFFVFIGLMPGVFAQGFGTTSTGGFISGNNAPIITPTLYGTGNGITSPQIYQPSFQEFYSKQGIDYKLFWPMLENADKCEARQDFILYIPAGGCSPSVVRSDLLEEQNVPVFCQVDALKLNPLIDVSWIRSVKFSGQYPQEVSGLSWHPSRAALRMYYNLLQSPFLNNIGYVVVVLKRQPDESKMPESVRLNISAFISYDLEKAFGTGRAEYYLPTLSDDEWNRNYITYSFWRGKGFVRLNDVDENRASITIYQDKERKLSSFFIEKGKTSQDIYLPGFYCRAGIQVRYDGSSTPVKKAKIRIDDSEFFLREGEKFLDDRCRVVSIAPISRGGKVVVNCNGKNLEMALSIANTVNLLRGGLSNSIAVGEGIDGFYLLGTGELDKGVFSQMSDNGRRFVVFGRGINNSFVGDDGKIKKEYIDRISGIINEAVGKPDYKKIIADGAVGLLKGSIAEVLNYNETSSFGYNFSFAGNIDKEYSGEEIIIEEYFNNALKSADELARLYNEKTSSGETYGEKALSDVAELAGKIGKQKKQIEIYERIRADYPGTSSAYNAERQLEVLRKYNYGSSVNFVDIANVLHDIQLLDIQEPGINELSALFNIKNNETKLGLNDDYTYNYQSINHTLLVKTIERDRVILSHSYTDKQNKITTEEISLKVMERKPELSLELKGINYKAEAKIVILPKLPYQYSEANLTVQVGIEKRAIKLSDEKTTEMIKNLNESIEKFQKIVDNLGKTVKVMKGACLATIGVLLVKNFVTGLGGGVQARQAVMAKWNAYCSRQANGDRIGIDNCLRQNNSNIESDIAAYKTNLGEVNDNLKRIQDNSPNGLGGVDVTKATNDYREYMKGKYGGQKVSIYANNEWKDVTLTNEMINASSLTELRDLELGIKNSRSSSEFVKDLGGGSTYTIMRGSVGIEERARIIAANNNLTTVAGDPNKVHVDTNAPIREVIIRPYYGDTYATLNNNGYKGFLGNQSGDTPMQVLQVGGEYYVAELAPSARGTYVPTKWYKLNYDSSTGSRNLMPVSDSDKDIMLKLKQITFQRQDSTTLTNPWGTPKISFHETGAFKGLPAILPLGNKWGRQRGWYAATKSYGIFEANAPAAYTESAIPQYYDICNVGPNKVEEYETSVGDDLCQGINARAGAPEKILGLSKEDSRELYQASQTALYQSASQYAQNRGGNQRIKVLDDAEGFLVGAPPVMGGARCQDFMSPQDCQIMFNICDPVLCPPSRCNLGGAFPVADVIQSGIIGSTVLCLPNFREGVYIPVCLSGIQAGLDGYLQILKLVRSCLEDSLATGRNVGICDEIKSIYMCEFFWRQISPLSKLVVSKLIEVATGQGTRGGGEYLTVKDSFDNLEKSINYVKNDYAVNAYQAFLKRSTDDIGTEICKGFISARYPNDKKFLDNLLEPESPVQFYATFNEIKYSEATIPATSQYKVYYAIYAGKDEAAYYSIYLKSPPDSGYYMQQEYITVAVGFVAKGGAVDETKDFTAPAGYKELCVRINGKDECGFKQVSTSFAVNYLRDQYVKDQASTTDITSDEECVSGTSVLQGGSTLGMVQPNLQEGVETGINPTIYASGYQSGVTRICASVNPGKSIDPNVASDEARWRKVGYCRKTETPVFCWLDTQSVEDAIRNKNLANSAINDVTAGELRTGVEGVVMSLEQTTKELSKLRQDVEGLGENELKAAPRISDKSVFGNSTIGGLASTADKIEQYGSPQSARAEALSLKYVVLAKVVRKLCEGYCDRPVVGGSAGGSTSPSAVVTQPEGKSYSEELKIQFVNSPLNSILVRWNYNRNITEIKVEDGWIGDKNSFITFSRNSTDLARSNLLLSSSLYDSKSIDDLAGRLFELNSKTKINIITSKGTLKSEDMGAGSIKEMLLGSFVAPVAALKIDSIVFTNNTGNKWFLEVKHNCDYVRVRFTKVSDYGDAIADVTIGKSVYTYSMGVRTAAIYDIVAICYQSINGVDTEKDRKTTRWTITG